MGSPSMMRVFQIEIHLNDMSMRTDLEVADALRGAAMDIERRSLGETAGEIRDFLGHPVGHWHLKEED